MPRWYKLLLCEERRKSRFFQASSEDLCGVDDYDLQVGRPISGWNTNSWIASTTLREDGRPDDVLAEHLGIPTLSRRMRLALKKAGVAANDVQYLPIRVFKSTGEEIKGYAIANVVTRIAALDFDRTDWSIFGPEPDDPIDPETGKQEVKGMLLAALKEDLLIGHDVIRLVEFWPSVYVSERFVEVYRAHGFTGATFTPAIMV